MAWGRGSGGRGGDSRIYARPLGAARSAPAPPARLPPSPRALSPPGPVPPPPTPWAALTFDHPPGPASTAHTSGCHAFAPSRCRLTLLLPFWLFPASPPHPWNGFWAPASSPESSPGASPFPVPGAALWGHVSLELPGPSSQERPSPFPQPLLPAYDAHSRPAPLTRDLTVRGRPQGRVVAPASTHRGGRQGRGRGGEGEVRPQAHTLLPPPLEGYRAQRGQLACAGSHSKLADG